MKTEEYGINIVNNLYRKLIDLFIKYINSSFDIMSYTQHIKEFLISNIILPNDITNVIKSFAFYDIKTASLIKQSKLTKRRTNKLIKEAVSDVRISEIHLIDRDDPSYSIICGLYDTKFTSPESWGFGYFYHSTERTQIQGYNCLKCGNYKPQFYIERICCSCEEEEE